MIITCIKQKFTAASTSSNEETQECPWFNKAAHTYMRKSKKIFISHYIAYCLEFKKSSD